MAVMTIEELISRKEKIEGKKKALWDIETSAGTWVIKPPSRSLVTEAMDLEMGRDDYLILQCVAEPDLKDKRLQEAYNCAEPTDIISRLLTAGEINAVANKILECSGYGKNVKAELHEAAKN